MRRGDVVIVARAAIADEIGRCNEEELAAAEDALRGWLGLDWARLDRVVSTFDRVRRWRYCGVSQREPRGGVGTEPSGMLDHLKTEEDLGR